MSFERFSAVMAARSASQASREDDVPLASSSCPQNIWTFTPREAAPSNVESAVFHPSGETNVE